MNKKQSIILQRTYIILIFCFMYLPIAVMIAFSFNESKSRSNFTGFTLDWYVELFHNDMILNALWVTLAVSALAAVIVLGIAIMVAVRKLPKDKKFLFRGQTGMAMILAATLIVNLICTGPMFTMISLATGGGKISEETSATVRECLEYVVAKGTGKNGQVAGYRIGGKTGTADKGQTGDVVVSFLCFAPADDPQIMMLITMDTPSRSTGTYVSGGNMVAPYASHIMEEILPYLGIEPSYSAEELMGVDTTVPNVIGMSVQEAKDRMKERGFTCKVEGDGESITDQTPVGGAIIPGKSTVVLYAGVDKPDKMCTVPSLVGRTASEANTAATNAGLLLRFTGTTSSESNTVLVFSQDLEAGTEVPAGTVITVRLGDTTVRD